jgi:hypothetical protein
MKHLKLGSFIFMATQDWFSMEKSLIITRLVLNGKIFIITRLVLNEKNNSS